MCMNVQDMKFLWSNPRLGGLSIDDADADAEANTWWAIHDNIGSSAFMHFAFLYQKCWDKKY